MRYWQTPAGLATTEDGYDLAAEVPAAVELDDLAAYDTAAAAGVAAMQSTASKITDLSGNDQTYSTDPAAKTVVITVHEPEDGNRRARPTVDDTPVTKGIYTYDRPGVAIAIATRAGNNDLTIMETF